MKVRFKGEKFVSKFVSKSGINTRFYVLFDRYDWYGYPSCTTLGEVYAYRIRILKGPGAGIGLLPGIYRKIFP